MLQEYLSLALLPVVPDWTFERALDLTHDLLWLGLWMDMATQFRLDAAGLRPPLRAQLGSWLLLLCEAFPHLLLLPTCVVAVPLLPLSISPLRLPELEDSIHITVDMSLTVV